MFTADAIRWSYPLGRGRGPVRPTAFVARGPPGTGMIGAGKPAVLAALVVLVLPAFAAPSALRRSPAARPPGRDSCLSARRPDLRSPRLRGRATWR
jgi:hypothetical protein